MKPTGPSSVPGLPADSPVSLESILCTDELDRRPSRPPDHETENRALTKLARALADAPDTILQTLADTILETIQADSAGLSLLIPHDGRQRFYWPAIAGAWKPHVGGGTPREFGPCGDVLDRNAPLLFKRFEQRYPYLRAVTPPAEEALLIPFSVNGRVVGTIWAMAHDDRKRFDAEDLRQLESVGRFASAAYQAAQLRQADDSRRAALNLMEDAVHAREVAEQRNAKLLESERRFRAMIDALPAAVYTTDAQGRLTHFNPAAVEFAGRTPVLGEDEWCVTAKLFRPDGTPLPHDESPMTMAIREGHAIHGLEAIAERPDGTRVWGAPYPTPLRNSAGEIVGGINMVVDITGRKRSEALLSCQKEAFEMAALGAPLLAVLEFLARAAESQSLKPSWVAIHLLDESGTRFEQTAAPSLPAAYRQAVDGMAVSSATGPGCAAVAGGVRVVAPDIAGCEEWAAFASLALPLGIRAAWSTPIFSLGGKVLGTFASYSPEVREPSREDELLGEILTRTAAAVIERKQSETSLAESEERFRTLADNMSQFAWTADANGWIYWYNQRWYDYTGTTLEEMQGWGWKKVHHPDHVDRVVARIQRSWDTGEVWEDTFPLRGRDGRYRWFLSRALPIRDAEGRVTRWFGTHTDVTEQRDMADELRRTSADLSEADRRKNEFLAMLAHELRNPLAPLRNSLQIIRLDGANGSTVAAAATMMERQVGHLVRLVDDLLDVSRITRGRIELRRERIEAAALVGQAVEAARPEAEHRGIELTMTMPATPVHLDADATRLAQVVGNLLNNALKFTDERGRIGVTVELDGEIVVLRVRDSGIGLGADQLSRIFELFMQVDVSLERSISGLGIGLTLVKSLVEMHDGTVEARSPGLGRGSEFVVRLPLAAPTAGRPLPDPPDRREAGPAARRILVVDDNVDAATSLGIVLGLGGNETRLAHDGVEAVAAAEAFRPEVVLLDIGLPRLNGYEVARAIREQPWGAGMLLVALTGWGQDEDRRKSSEAGFDAHLVKPVDPLGLMKLLAGLPAPAN